MSCHINRPNWSWDEGQPHSEIATISIISEAGILPCSQSRLLRASLVGLLSHYRRTCPLRYSQGQPTTAHSRRRGEGQSSNSWLRWIEQIGRMCLCRDRKEEKAIYCFGYEWNTRGTPNIHPSQPQEYRCSQPNRLVWNRWECSVALQRDRRPHYPLRFGRSRRGCLQTGRSERVHLTELCLPWVSVQTVWCRVSVGHSHLWKYRMCCWYRDDGHRQREILLPWRVPQQDRYVRPQEAISSYNGRDASKLKKVEYWVML